MSSIEDDLYKYLGDYKDESERAIRNLYHVRIKSVEEAISIAKTEKWPVFGLQYHGELWYGFDVDRATQFGTWAGTYKPDVLGEDWMNRVYVLKEYKWEKKESAEDDLYEYLGDYKDANERAIPNLYHIRVKSVEEAISIANTEEWPVFGLQYHGELWYGFEVDTATQFGPWAGTYKPDVLGEDWMNRVYVLKEIEKTTKSAKKGTEGPLF